MTINRTLVILIVALITVLLIIRGLFKSKKRNDLYNHFILLNIAFSVHLIGLILQIIFKDSKISPIYFDYITYIGGAFEPLLFFKIALLYYKRNIDIKIYRWMYILPIIFIAMVWTNDWHHLFYIKYSIQLSDTIFGPLLILFAIYSYSFLVISMIMFAIGSIRESGFFSKQSLLIILGLLVPLVGNLMGVLKIISLTIYVTPMLFIVTSICLALAVIKFKALNIVPVAFKTVVDSMSDSFVVISDDGTIADMNKTFKITFNNALLLEDKDNIFDTIKTTKVIDLDIFTSYLNEAKEKKKVITKEWDMKIGEIDKCFEVDIQAIKAKSGNEYVASLLLFRDITNQKRDIDILTKKENLVILGELAGGVAHDINTPISAIKSGLLMLKDTAKNDDEKMLMSRMDNCADKIIALVNSLRNQIRNIGSDEKMPVNIASVIKDTSIIANNELVKSGVKLNIKIKDDLTVTGEPTKLGQVITNIVMNAVQAYEGKPGIVDIDLYKSSENYAVITIEDYAGGIPESIRPYIFKNILTTKGVSGTGFGLYLAYSVIKGAFGGEISFVSKEGKGTRFYISIPLDAEE